MKHIGHIDSYDAQEILRALELSCATVSANLGKPASHLVSLVFSWCEIMEKAGIDRYGNNNQSIHLSTATGEWE